MVRRRPARVMRGALRALTVVVGWLVLALALDVGLGLAVDAVTGSGPPDATVTADPFSAPAVTPPACNGRQAATAESRAMARRSVYRDDPWNLEYWCEFDQAPTRYVPYLYSQHVDSQQPLINIEDGVRRSYEPSGQAGDRPVIWFFGGSTMWGWGQRDLHTIPSEVARLAEAAGEPVQVVNFGQLGWVHWQEVLGFERALASRPAPDLVVFYDGANDVNTQSAPVGFGGRPSDQPTIYDFDNDPPPELPTTAPSAGSATWAASWADTSAVAQLSRGISRSLGIDSAGATTGQEPTPSFDTVVDRIVDIYTRGRAVAAELARRHAVRALYTWQPRSIVNDAPGQQTEAVYEAVRARLPADTVDLAHAFDGIDEHTTFSDDAHTNEHGAHVVAAAMWPWVRAALARPASAGASDGGSG